MKIFNTIQELWDYCAFCPICRSDVREVEIQVGPTRVFELVSCEKTPNLLHLRGFYRNKQNSYPVNYDINCVDNSFVIEVGDPTELVTPQDEITNIRPYFYFWIQGTCLECTASSAHGADLELALLNRTISNVQLERESIYLDNGYHLALLHDSNTLLVSELVDSESTRSSNKPSIKLPLPKLDLSDQTKVIDKIKTLILFS